MLVYWLTWMSLILLWCWWRIGIGNRSNLSQAWQRSKRHSTIKSWPILASTERQMYLICWAICAHSPPIGRHHTSHFYWEQTHQSTRKICCKWWMKRIVGLEKLVELPQKLSRGWCWKGLWQWEVDQFLIRLKRINNQNQLGIGNWHINRLKDGLSYVDAVIWLSFSRVRLSFVHFCLWIWQWDVGVWFNESNNQPLAVECITCLKDSVDNICFIRWLGNWKGIRQWEVNQILLQSALELLNESDNQPECKFIWFVVTCDTCYQLEDAACLVWFETLSMHCQLGSTAWLVMK